MWLPAIAVIIIAVVLALSGDTGREWLRFDRQAIANGDFWRLISGHFVHLSPAHLALNIAGLLLIWHLIGSSLTWRHWLLVCIAALIGMNAGFWWLQPHLESYVGLSGLLHGVLAAGIVSAAGSKQLEIWILGAALIAKLTYEQLLGPLPGSEETSGGTVIVAAHAYGAISGAVAAGLIMIRVRRRASI